MFQRSKSPLKRESKRFSQIQDKEGLSTQLQSVTMLLRSGQINNFNGGTFKNISVIIAHAVSQPLNACFELDAILLNPVNLQIMEENQDLKNKFATLYRDAIHLLATTRIGYSRELFIAIPEAEFSSDSKKIGSTPAYFKMMDDFERSSFLIQTDIAKRDSVEGAVLATERWILVLKQCLEAKDFHGVQLILKALSHDSIAALRRSKDDNDLLSGQAATILSEANQLLANDQALLRKLMAEEGAIPDLNLFEKDLKDLKEKARPEEFQSYSEGVVSKLVDMQGQVNKRPEKKDVFWQTAQQANQALFISNVNIETLIDIRFKEDVRLSDIQEYLYQAITDPLEYALLKIQDVTKNNPKVDATEVLQCVHQIQQIQKNKSSAPLPLVELIEALETFKSCIPLKHNVLVFKKKNEAFSKLTDIIESLKQYQEKNLGAKKIDLKN